VKLCQKKIKRQELLRSGRRCLKERVAELLLVGGRWCQKIRAKKSLPDYFCQKKRCHQFKKVRFHFFRNQNKINCQEVGRQQNATITKNI